MESRVVGGFFKELHKSTGRAPFLCSSESFQQLTTEWASPLATTFPGKKVARKLGKVKAATSQGRRRKPPPNQKCKIIIKDNARYIFGMFRFELSILR